MGRHENVIRAVSAAAILSCLGAAGRCENGPMTMETLQTGAYQSFAASDAGAVARSAEIDGLKKRQQVLIASLQKSPRAPAQDPYNTLIWDRSSRGDWYEWWYYKVVLPGTSEAFYFCYGVVNPWDVKQTRPASRAFVDMGSFGAGEIVSRTYAPGEFAAASDRTFVQIGDNVATDRALKGRLRTRDGEEVSWDLSLKKDWGFNAMGWAMSQGWFSNIFWYPAQAGATMSGRITYRGKTITLDHAPAYQDRNWGSGFPRWWTWLVSNHFKNSPGTVLAAGGGQPKIFPGTELLQGVSIGLRHKGREYVFQPTNGDSVKMNVRFGKWEVSARNVRYERIEISAYAPPEKFLLLKFMTPQGLVFNDYETLLGRIRVKLYRGSRLIADLETDEGGIEFGSHEKADFEGLFSK